MSLEKIFSNQDKEALGNKREVYGVKGKEGIDFIVKDKQSDEELEALIFLSETDVAEKLLIHDKDKLVLEKIDGGYSRDYIEELIKNNPDKHTESEAYNTESNSRFKIISETRNYVPGSVIVKDEQIRKFYVDYISKLLFLVSTGILHKDIKIDNIFTDKDGDVKFTDFGEVSIVDSKKETGYMVTTGVLDLSKGLELMQALNPIHGEIAKKVINNEKIKNIIKDLYNQYKQENIHLNNRPILLKQLAESGAMRNLIGEIGLPKKILPDIENKLLSIIAVYQ